MVTRRAFSLFILGFFALWTLAWLKHQLLVVGWHWWSADNHPVELIYWAIMKCVIWVVYPALWWWKRVPNIRDFIGLAPSSIKSGYQWGSLTTLIWVGAALAAMPLLGQSFGWPDHWASYVYAATLTPIMEEILFRGFIISGFLALKIDGKIANLMTTILFLLIHGVGWAFQGVFLQHITSTAVVSIALLSILAGFIRIHSGSLRASMLLHIGNNGLAGLIP